MQVKHVYVIGPQVPEAGSNACPHVLDIVADAVRLQFAILVTAMNGIGVLSPKSDLRIASIS